MGTVNVTLGEDTQLNLLLGRQMENAVTEVVFDFSAWNTTYGSGTLALSVQRPGDTQPYAVVLSVSGTNATWSISSLDTAYKGIGEIQLTYTVGAAIKKSVIYKFTVYQSLGENGEYPSPGQTWQEEIEEELSDVKQDLNDMLYDSLELYASEFVITSSSKWTPYGGMGFIVPVKPNDIVVIESSAIYSYYAVLKSKSNMVYDGSPDFATGYSNRVGYRYATTITVPADGYYIWFYKEVSGTDYTPNVFSINGYNALGSSLASGAELSKDVENHINALRGDISSEFDDFRDSLSRLELDSSYNKITEIEDGYYYNLSGTKGASSSYKCTKDIIPVEQGDIVKVYGLETPAEWSARYITAYDVNGNAVSASGAESTATYEVPSGIVGIRVTLYASHTYPMVTINYVATSYLPPITNPKYQATEAFLGEYAKGNSANLLDNSTVTQGAYVRLNGSVVSDANYAVTDYLPVTEGETIYSFWRGLALSCRFITAYNRDKHADASKGVENASTYIVPENVAFIRVTIGKNYLPSPQTVISDVNLSMKYQPYYTSDLPTFAKKNYTDIQNLYNYPLSSLPPYMIGALAYRTLGQLSKGYVCLVSDDGLADVATYTIPMVISKGVPLTIAAMQASTCWDNGTAQATVIDAIENHGCELAQHGGSSWLNFDEQALNYFFEQEAIFWDSLGLTPYGAVCPQHDINDVIRVVAGGRFKCLRTGYIDQYEYYNNGARSNVFGLSSQSSLDGGLENQTLALDEAKEKHYLRMIHWHENELTAEHKATLEGLIDYAKNIGLTFITMKDIPTII